MQNNLMGVPLEGFAQLARSAAAEGAVLLKNEASMLPIRPEEPVSVFGRCQLDFYRSGTGSGGSVCVPYSTNLLDGLRSHLHSGVNETLAGEYERWISAHPVENGGGAWAAEPWFQREMPLEEETVRRARDFSQKALVVIGRTAGEDKDNKPEPGSFLLTDEELSMLALVSHYFQEVALILNVSNIIDMGFLELPHIKDSIRSVLYVWQGGMEGGSAAADVICGKVSPGGKLPDTIARTYEDYPSSSSYGDPAENYYKEDIYVGYRYFETFAPEKVRYPFGYGLSYTDFSIRQLSAVIDTEADDICLTVTASVTNTGSAFSGKEVLQLYYEAPQGVLGKSAKSLAAFAKTRLLGPGESQTLTLTFPLYQMASYDDSGITGHKSCYVLEAGKYFFYLGTSVRHLCPVAPTPCGFYELAELKVVEALEEALSPVKPFERLCPGPRRADGSYEMSWNAVPQRSYDLKKRIQDHLPRSLPPAGQTAVTLQQVKSGAASLREFVAQFTPHELAALLRAEGMSNPRVTPGTASAFGGLLDSLNAYGLPIACCSDGPSGIRMERGLHATQLPIGTSLAATWNLPLVQELYCMEGRELLRNQIDNLLGPGLNIHRNPLNGRNFEYFSEDPYLTGMLAAAVVTGIREGGATCTLKHFACNNQETGRHHADSVVSERAIREIYLKAFEIAVKRGRANSIMTSYNPLNGHWTASSYDLTTTILRNEWGFTGIVMTDWWASVNDVEMGGPQNKTDLRSMVRAQNDLYMVITNNGAGINAGGDNIIAALEEQRLTLGELQRCAVNICSYLMEIPAFSRPLLQKAAVQTFEPAADGTDMPEKSISLEPVCESQADIRNPLRYFLITSCCFAACQ